MKISHYSLALAVMLLLTMMGTPMPTAGDRPGEDPGTDTALSGFQHPMIGSHPWYRIWSLDADRNRIDDRLERELEENGYAGHYPLFVNYREMPAGDQIRHLIDLGLEILYVARYMPTIAVAGADHHTIRHLASHPDVVMVERDYPIVPLLDISSPAVKARPSPFYSPETAWEEGYTGRDIVIAILDTGVDDNHESLNGKFVAGVDVSNQGFDILGNPDDGNGHGSHCAGIAMGNGGETDNNADGEPDYQGTAPDALLVDVKIGTDLGGNLGNSIIRGIEWCRDNKDAYDIRILSISFGSTASSDGQDATSRAANAAVLEDGLILVAAAGNSGPNNDGLPPPAAANEVITVANVDDLGTVSRGDDVIADSSSRGPRQDDGDGDPMNELKPDVAAPGERIMSVRHSEIGQGNPNIQGQYVEMSGTSMSCPHVAGIVACMLEANPDLTPAEVKTILRKTADPRGEPYDPSLDKHYSVEYGWGIVDAYGAVRGALGYMPIRDEVEIEITEPADGSRVSGRKEVRGLITTTGNVTLEEITLRIGGNRYNVTVAEVWMYRWNSWDVENGNYTLTATVIANNRSLSSTVSIMVSVNNTGEDPGDDDDPFFDIDDLRELNEITLSLMAVVAVAIIVSVVVFKRRHGGDGGTEEQDEYYDGEDDGSA